MECADGWFDNCLKIINAKPLIMDFSTFFPDQVSMKVVQ